MLFNSLDFILFLPVVIALYYIIPAKYRWVLLLVASYFFYMCWRVEYIFLIIGSTMVDYFVALKMDQKESRRKKLPLLLLSLGVNLGLLFTFKYLNFFADTANMLFGGFHIPVEIPMSKLLLPVGISFYTFQTLSYSIDVYFGRIKAERHLGYFALYVSFFPQLVAGPIERFSRLAPQLKAKHLLDYENLSKGFRLILYGLFIKMVVADNIASYVEAVYSSTAVINSIQTLTGIFLYSFQIYGDFYGYSLVAIGSARLLGIDIMDNFKTPYMSKSIGEFWQRWHISLSTWFRDYLYYPLGGNRVNKTRWGLNILIVFVVSGIWHGANWTFIFWGGLYGVFYLIEKGIMWLLKSFPKANRSLLNPLLMIKTFVLVSFIWVFFRSKDIEQAFDLLKGVFTNIGAPNAPDLGLSTITWVALILFILSDILLYNKRFDFALDKWPLLLRWFLYLCILFAIIAFSAVQNFPFIYFQF